MPDPPRESAPEPSLDPLFALLGPSLNPLQDPPLDSTLDPSGTLPEPPLKANLGPLLTLSGHPGPSSGPSPALARVHPSENDHIKPLTETGLTRKATLTSRGRL